MMTTCCAHDPPASNLWPRRQRAEAGFIASIKHKYIYGWRQLICKSISFLLHILRILRARRLHRYNPNRQRLPLRKILAEGRNSNTLLHTRDINICLFDLAGGRIDFKMLLLPYIRDACSFQRDALSHSVSPEPTSPCCSKELGYCPSSWELSGPPRLLAPFSRRSVLPNT